ncbi:MFS transporter [Candidatus Desantisbacteria bacterium]|nr:MFS transporter [Candidatus Desantisbacteria bacterium]
MQKIAKKTGSLLWRDKGFLSLVITQFLGALNDNGFKILLTLLVAEIITKPGVASQYVSIASAVFVLPFILFSNFAGYVSDRFSKYNVAVFAKILEIFVMALGLIGLYYKNVVFLMIVLFLMGLQSTIFGPAKLGILPEMLDNKDLSNANGIMDLYTFTAIIAGTILGGVLLNITKPDFYLAGWVFVLIAVLGTLSSFFITKVPSVNSAEKLDWNPIRSFYSNMKEIKNNRALFLSILGIAYFWFIAAMFQMDLLLYGKILMNADSINISKILAVLGIGIGIGSGIAGKISGEKTELGLVPLGSLGMGLFSIDLVTASNSFTRVTIDLFCLGCFAGFFVVPLNTLLQEKSPKDSKGRMIATSNILSFIGVFFASFLIWLFTGKLGFDPAKTIGIMSLGVFAVTMYTLWILPEPFIRLVLWFLTHTIYHIKSFGKENVPNEGPALLVVNHLSYIDPLLVGATLSRSVRFFMWRPIYELKQFNWFFRLMHMIPISASDKPKQFIASMEEARKALKEGHIVCIFAEGAISRVAQTLGFHRGMEVVAKDMDIPIIPVNLDRVWGSIFSFHQGKFIWKIPGKIPYPVTVSFGKPLPAISKVYEVRQAVLELGSEAFNHRFKKLLPLHSRLLRQAKEQWFAKGMADSSGLELTYGKIITASVLLSRKFTKYFPEEERIGVLFPSCVHGALVNIALNMSGKIPVNLNFTMSQNLLEKVLVKAGIKKIITSRKVIEGLKWEHDKRMVYLEDMGKSSKISSFLFWISLFVIPSGLIERVFIAKSRVKNNDIATLIFTSGSTGIPKGVVLTHNNIHSNVQGLLEVFQTDSNDSLMGVLPFFHSFGYTATIWLPLLGGFSVVYHRSPLEPVIIQKMIKQHKCTMVLTTPTFLQMWMKKFQKEDVSTLRFVIAGAEKLRSQIAGEYLEKFGVPVLEGYGCTELSPVACVSVFNVKDKHEYQLGHKEGKVGRPLPGVSVSIVDPETGKALPTNHPGLLLVKGPNVMKGYWEDKEKTDEVIKDNWYITGDIASIDEDGFIQITDRLSRFSKIGGEMVSHIMVEEKIYEAALDIDAKFLIVSVHDDKKGEALVVLYHNYSGDIEALYEKLGQSDIPNLWIPNKKSFFKIDEWPTLGTGKVDMAKAKEIAKSLAGTV